MKQGRDMRNIFSSETRIMTQPGETQFTIHELQYSTDVTTQCSFSMTLFRSVARGRESPCSFLGHIQDASEDAVGMDNALDAAEAVRMYSRWCQGGSVNLDGNTRGFEGSRKVGT